MAAATKEVKTCRRETVVSDTIIQYGVGNAQHCPWTASRMAEAAQSVTATNGTVRLNKSVAVHVVPGTLAVWGQWWPGLAWPGAQGISAAGRR